MTAFVLGIIFGIFIGGWIICFAFVQPHSSTRKLLEDAAAKRAANGNR